MIIEPEPRIVQDEGDEFYEDTPLVREGGRVPLIVMAAVLSAVAVGLGVGLYLATRSVPETEVIVVPCRPSSFTYLPWR